MNCIAGDSTYDIARKEWGGNWRLPTKAEFQELIDNCKFEFITVNRIKGYKVTSMNSGKSMFLPTAGWCFGDMYYKQGHYGRYRSATLDESDSLCAYYLNCYDDFIDICKSYCHDGLCVRPVASK